MSTIAERLFGKRVVVESNSPGLWGAFVRIVEEERGDGMLKPSDLGKLYEKASVDLDRQRGLLPSED